MKKLMILLAAASLVAAGSYAQTQRTNRTKVRTHDRSGPTYDGKSTDQPNTDRADKTNHEADMDRNNTNRNTNTGNQPAKTTPGNNGTNTNGGTGTNGSSINSNNPK